MSYPELRKQADRHPISIVELQLDDGEGNVESVSLSKDIQPFGYSTFACIKTVTEAPTQLTTAGGVSFDSEINVTCQDFAVDGGGTFFGKLLARNPYWLDRNVILKVGYLVDDQLLPENMNSRTYFMSQVSGPDGNGVIKFKAKGMMSRISDDRDQAPKGVGSKLVDILQPLEVGVIDIGTTKSNDKFVFPETGYAIIEDEIVAYIDRTDTTINIQYRGQLGTTDSEHSVGEAVGAVYYFSGNPVDIITDLLTNFTSNEIIPLSIDSAMFLHQREAYLQGAVLEVVVIEPTSVKEIITQISQQAYLSVWWDEQAPNLNAGVPAGTTGLIKLMAVNGYDFESIPELDEQTQILKGKYSINHSLQKMVTEAWIYYNRKDPTKGDSGDNYGSLDIFINQDSSNRWGTPASGTIPAQPLVKPQIIYAAFVNDANGANRLGQLVIDRNKEGLRMMNFTVDASSNDFWTGDTVIINTSLLQKTDGSPQRAICEITKAKQINEAQYEFSAIIPFVGYSPNFGLISPNTTPDWTSSSSTETLKYMYISGNDGKMSDGSDAPTIRV